MKRFRLSKLFDSNRFIMVFAVVIAMISWVTVAMGAEETTVARIHNVPVNLDMQVGALQHFGLRFIGAGEPVVSVDVFGPRTVVGQLTPEDFLLTVNVAHVNVPDTYDLRVESASPASSDFQIVGFYPPVIPRVRLDQLETRDFAVELDIELEAAIGYMADTPRLIPATSVRVSGPHSDLERVYRVAAIVELDYVLSAPFAQEVPLTLLDIMGNEIDPVAAQLSLDFDSLTVQIPVLRVRELPLVVEFQNLPSGFPEARLRQYMFQSARTITIAGPISTMQGFQDWRLGFINLRNLTHEDNWFIFDIDLPSEQFINIDNLQSVAIEFDSEYWDTTVLNIPGEDILLTNRPAGAEIALQTVTLSSVTFVGDAEEIAGLTLSDVVVEVNLNDRELVSGTQPYPVRISVPGRNMVWPVDEGNLIVYINATLPD